MNSLVESYTKDELTQIVNISMSWIDLARKLGYQANSIDQQIRIQKRVLELGIDTSHFSNVVSTPIKRNIENIFIKDSTASQKTLRTWFKKENFVPYKCAICGLEAEWQGKELTLILDHINGVNTDDRIENLRWVCPNCNMQLPTTNRQKKSIKKYYCIDCGKEISKGSVRCRACNSKKQILPLEKMEVTRDELKQMIRTIPFTQIGIKFGVSDNAIRKWCDKYNLPRKVSEIKTYSDEEWDLI